MLCVLMEGEGEHNRKRERESLSLWQELSWAGWVHKQLFWVLAECVCVHPTCIATFNRVFYALAKLHTHQCTSLLACSTDRQVTHVLFLSVRRTNQALHLQCVT